MKKKGEKGQEWGGQGVKRERKRRFKRRKRERRKECLEDALETSLSRAARRFPDDYSLHGSVFREGYLLRAHKPTETLKKRPASTRLRSKKVARRATAAITAAGCWGNDMVGTERSDASER